MLACLSLKLGNIGSFMLELNFYTCSTQLYLSSFQISEVIFGLIW